MPNRRKRKKKKGRNRFEKALQREQDSDAALGTKLIGQFLPNLETLGTVDAGRSNEIQNLLNELKANSNLAGQRSSEVADLVALMRGGLGGFTSAEGQANRELAQREIDNQFQTQSRALQRLQSRGNIRGAAAGAQFGNLARDRFGAQGDIEVDLLARNAALQDSRRNAFGSFLQGLEADEFNRKTQALTNFGQALERARADELGRQQFNLGQQGKLLAGQQALFFGGAQLNQARRNALRNFRLGKGNLKLATRQNQNSGGGGGASSGGGGAGVFDFLSQFGSFGGGGAGAAPPGSELIPR